MFTLLFIQVEIQQSYKLNMDIFVRKYGKLIKQWFISALTNNSNVMINKHIKLGYIAYV